MTFEELTRTLAILRQGEELEKVGGMLSKAKEIGKAITGATAKAGGEIAAKGHPLIGKAVQYAPHAAALYAGKKALESPTGQRMRYKFQMWKAQRQARKAQGGYR